MSDKNILRALLLTLLLGGCNGDPEVPTIPTFPQTNESATSAEASSSYNNNVFDQTSSQEELPFTEEGANQTADETEPECSEQSVEECSEQSVEESVEDTTEESATEEPTEPSAPEPTEAPTEAPTVAPTVAPTQAPQTTKAPVTQAPQTTQAPTQAPTQESITGIEVTVVEKDRYIGDTLTTSDFQVYALTLLPSATTKKTPLSSFTISPSVLSAENTTVTISYNGFSKTVTVTAKKKEEEKTNWRLCDVRICEVFYPEVNGSSRGLMSGKHNPQEEFQFDILKTYIDGSGKWYEQEHITLDGSACVENFINLDYGESATLHVIYEGLTLEKKVTASKGPSRKRSLESFNEWNELRKSFGLEPVIWSEFLYEYAWERLVITGGIDHNAGGSYPQAGECLGSGSWDGNADTFIEACYKDIFIEDPEKKQHRKTILTADRDGTLLYGAVVCEPLDTIASCKDGMYTLEIASTLNEWFMKNAFGCTEQDSKGKWIIPTKSSSSLKQTNIQNLLRASLELP